MTLVPQGPDIAIWKKIMGLILESWKTAEGQEWEAISGENDTFISHSIFNTVSAPHTDICDLWAADRQPRAL